MSGKYSDMPLWAKILIIVSALPVCAYPWMLVNAGPGQDVKVFLWLYPFYVLAAAICAWICWPERREIAWILIIIMLLTHAGMFYLTFA